MSRDGVVEREADAMGESLNEHPDRRELQPLDLAGRRMFALDNTAWAELHTVLDRPVLRKPELAELLLAPSILEP